MDPLAFFRNLQLVGVAARRVFTDHDERIESLENGEGGEGGGGSLTVNDGSTSAETTELFLDVPLFIDEVDNPEGTTNISAHPHLVVADGSGTTLTEEAEKITVGNGLDVEVDESGNITIKAAPSVGGGALDKVIFNPGLVEQVGAGDQIMGSLVFTQPAGFAAELLGHIGLQAVADETLSVLINLIEINDEDELLAILRQEEVEVNAAGEMFDLAAAIPVSEADAPRIVQCVVTVPEDKELLLVGNNGGGLFLPSYLYAHAI